MKKKIGIILLSASLLFGLVATACAEDAPLPMATSGGQKVSMEAITKGGLDPKQPIYCHNDGNGALGWTNSESNKMTPMADGMLCPGISAGMRFHPFQKHYLWIEKAHPNAFAEHAKGVEFNEKGEVAYKAY